MRCALATAPAKILSSREHWGVLACLGVTAATFVLIIAVEFTFRAMRKLFRANEPADDGRPLA